LSLCTKMDITNKYISVCDKGYAGEKHR